MKFLVFGSLNIDRVYSLKHLPEKGETLSCDKYEIHVGGKGLNQAVSLSKAGADVYMAGCIGEDGKMLTDFLSECGVNTDNVKIIDRFTGHAVIEVDSEGQNQMVLYRGANHEITEEDCDRILENFSEGDLILMQYETSQVEYMINKAYDKKMIIALNPSPYVEEIKSLTLDKVDYLILNEFEGKCLSGENDTEKTVRRLLEILKDGAVILTLGKDGSVYADNDTYEQIKAYKVNAVDTTGAGDTFTGYFLMSYLSGIKAADSLDIASAASAITVCRRGAAETIPDKIIVEQFFINMN